MPSNSSILELGIEESYKLVKKIACNNYDSRFGKMIMILDLQEIVMMNDDRIHKSNFLENQLQDL